MKRLAATFLLTIATSAFAQPGTVDETAKFLAGMPVNGALTPLMQAPGWQEHATAMDDAWDKKARRQIAPISAWMQTNASDAYNWTGPMYYMFSGPDSLYANIFCPRANTYILAGLEPVGNVPDLTQIPPETLGADLAGLRESMSTILKFQYFITKDMRAGLGGGHISGTLPIIYVFLARLGYTVMDATHVSSPAEGVKITFSANGAQPQTLYYFKTDLSGGGSKFLQWCGTHGPGVSLLKAASYLMHGDGFAGVRNFLLNNSRIIVQDDSGIPLRAFPKNWRIDCYGAYVPHPEFQKYWQPDLAAVFAKNPPSELGFAFGYHWQKERGILMICTHEGVPRATLVEPPPAAAARTDHPKTNRRSRAAQPPAAKKE
ncbi:MAG: hypothetical protein ACJ8KU_11660 [Chthoniobacterales bacterium]